MSLLEQIITVKQFHELTIKEKKSEFIAQIYPLITADGADEILKTVRKKYFNASHNCFAYKFLNDVHRYSDDGEPSGTAGIRILNAIEHFDLTNLLLVVTRYFGGTKLGVGPLGKAYYASAINVLEEVEKAEKHLFEEIIVKIDVSSVSQLYKIVSFYKGKVKKSDFQDGAIFKLIIQPKFVNPLKNDLTEVLKGKIEVKTTDRKLYL